MSVEEKDLVPIGKNQNMEHTAEYVANKRVLFEYPRKGYGSYAGKNHVNMIKAGVLGELAFLEYIMQHLNSIYGSFPPEARNNAIQKAKFRYSIIIGTYDNGFDFKIKDKKIDVKTYSKEVDLDEMLKLNLFIDEDQNTKADIYVQAFLMKGGQYIYLAGYNVGLPELVTWPPNSAYAKKVTELEKMNNIFKELGLGS